MSNPETTETASDQPVSASVCVVGVLAEALAQHREGAAIVASYTEGRLTLMEYSCSCGWRERSNWADGSTHPAHVASVVAALPNIAIELVPEPKAELEHSAEYWIAARDNKGCIRLNQGRGLHVANSEHTRADVQGWLDRAGSVYWGKVYTAALVLIDSENHATEGIL